MPAASGVFKSVTYKMETSYGVAPAPTLFTPLRRKMIDLSVVKDTYQSEEIRTDQQVQDLRHGVRRVQGTLTAELAPGAFADFFAIALRRDFATVSSLTGLSLTIAASGSDYTVAGVTNALTSGIKIGDVVRITAGTGLNPDVLNKNLLVLNIVSTTLTVRVLNGSSMTAGSGTSCTIQMPGKKTYVPTSSHTNKSMAIEQWFADMPTPQNELYLGCQPANIDLQLPATGLAEMSVGLTGYSVTTSASRYSSSYTAANTKGLLAAVNGVLAIGGSTVANVTGASLSIQSNRSGDPVVGNNFIPTQYPGRVIVTGQLTAYFESVTLRDAFLNETDTSIVLAMTSGNLAADDFLTIALPRVKCNGHTINDGEGGIVATIPFQALLPTSGGSGVANELTTISIHDSAA